MMKYLRRKCSFCYVFLLILSIEKMDTDWHGNYFQLLILLGKSGGWEVGWVR